MRRLTMLLLLLPVVAATRYPGIDSKAGLRVDSIPYLGNTLQHPTAPVVTRGPYLQLATPTEITIRWRTDRPATCNNSQ